METGLQGTMAVKAHFRGPQICFESSKRNKKDCQSNTYRDSEGNKPTMWAKSCTKSKTNVGFEEKRLPL